MISVRVKKKDNVVTSITIKGHALFQDIGKDIVCAGVSSSLATTINAIISFDEDAIKYVEKPYFKIDNLKEDNITNTLLNNFIDVLKDIELKYNKNINIKEEL